MSDTEQWQLIPESECDDQDDYPDDEQIRRDIAGWEREDAAWQRGEIALRTTIFHDGQRLDPEMMTRAQYDARLAELNVEKTADPTSDPYTLITQLLEWTGRKAATADEAEHVSGLRRRAETLLKQVGVC